MANIVVRPKTSIMLPDNGAWTNRFYIRSESIDRMYTVAQSKTGRWWACGCFGFIRYKRCKHLESLGLPCYHKPYEALVQGGKEDKVA